MCLDAKKYLTAASNYFEYMKVLLAVFPVWIRKQFNLDDHAHNRYVYLRMERAVLGLTHVGILANKLHKKRLVPHGYYECINTLDLWKHKWCPISFTLVMDDFGIKYIGNEHANHLVECIRT
jgi:hypothetical protein